MTKSASLIVLAALLHQAARPQVGVVPLLHAHAHNDCRDDPPLLKALAHGFTGVDLINTDDLERLKAFLLKNGR